MKDAAMKEFGRIDILLNNAAGNFISPTERLTHSAFDLIPDIVLKGTKNCTLQGKYWLKTKFQVLFLILKPTLGRVLLM